MYYYSKCPECGETNYSQSHSYADRHFDCGFRSDSVGNRLTKCSRLRLRRAHQGKYTADDNVARYRLALLDAAQVVDTIASDMRADGQRELHIERLRQLSLQLRGFAGHSDAGSSFDDLSARSKGAPKNMLVALFRRATQGRDRE